jgi:hypothetical protein
MPRLGRALLLATIAFAIVLAGCSSDSTNDLFENEPEGNVRVLLTSGGSSAAAVLAGRGEGKGDGSDADEGGDEPGDEPAPSNPIVGVVIRVSDFEARSTTLQQFVDIAAEFPVEVDLVALSAGGGSFELAVGSLAPDTYDELIIVLSALVLTAEDGTVVTIEPPGGGWTVPLTVEPFTVVEGEVTTIQLELDPSSFQFDIDADLGDLDADDFDPQFSITVGG